MYRKAVCPSDGVTLSCNSSTSDTIIFMFLGMVLISDDHRWHTGFCLWTLVLCLVFRFIGKSRPPERALTVPTG